MPKMSMFERAVCRSRPWRAFTSNLVLPWAMQGLRPSGRGLEIGAGSGAMATHLLVRYPGLHVTITDLDAEMLPRPNEHMVVVSDRLHVCVADATGLPFHDDYFDFVFSFIMLHHVLAWEQTLEEALRVLRPGGYLVGYDLLDGFLPRAFHRAEGAEFRLMRPGEFANALDMLPADRVYTRLGAAGLTIRFRVRKRLQGDGSGDATLTG
jgi:ubiquinone/menaquinone biosynthesis C-methylase UbiE